MMTITLYNKDLLDLALCGFAFGAGWSASAWVVTLIAGVFSGFFAKRK